MAVTGARLLPSTKPGAAGFWLLALLWCLAAPAEVCAQAPSLDPTWALTQYHRDTWTTADGLPQNSATSIVQTRDGYLWLGTQEGLARFDGLRFRAFDRASGDLPNKNISTLFEDRAGALWIGTRAGGLARYHDGRFTSFTQADGLPSARVSSFAEARDGTLWVGTFDAGLARYRDGRFVPLPDGHGLPSRLVSTLVAGRDGSIWIGLRDAGLVRYRPDSAGTGAGHFTTFTPADGLPAGAITVLTEGRDGSIWIGLRDAGLVRYRDGRFTSFSPADGLCGATVRALREDRAGTLWIGTEADGLCRLRDGRFTAFPADDPLGQGVVQAILEDREGSLWVGREDVGLDRLKQGKFVPFTTREGLAHDVVKTVAEDARGDVWIGTAGGLSRYRDGRFTTFTTRDGLSREAVFSVAGTRDGAVWVGTRDGGLNRLKDGRFTVFTTRDGLPDDGAVALHEDAAGDLWIGTDRGLARYRDGRFTTFSTADGLSSNFITTVVGRAAGGVWVGTYDGGLDLLRDGKVEAHYDTDTGLLSDFVLALYEDAAGTLWISTREGGLHRLKDGRLTAYRIADGLPSDNLFYLLEDDQGFFWMSSSKGLVVAARDVLEAFAEGRAGAVSAVVYDQNDGLRSAEFYAGIQPAGWKSRDGRLWFPTNAGLVAVDPANVPVNAQPPPVVVEAVLVDGEPAGTGGALTIRPGRSRFEFHYAGLSLFEPDEVRYRYRLVGIDDAWIDAGTRREAFYTNLAPGRYTFEVVALNNDGLPSTAPATVSFYLQPAFYQTPWFYVACLVLVVGATLAGHRLRVRRLEARQRELEQIVDDRTRSLREEKEKTEAAKLVIEEQADQLREMDRLKTRFFNNISHEFRTPLTLNIGPLENALAGVYGTLPDTMRKQVEIMLRNARRLLGLINQLLDLAKLEAGRMELKVQRGDLSALLEGIVLSFSGYAEKEGLVLEQSIEPADRPLLFDPENMEKVFFNLLSNAIKFTPEGGHIRVSSRSVAGGQVEVVVADTGPGIPPSELPYVFDRFHQASGTNSKRQHGTGIGLALVKEIVELHGGTVRVESEVGVGTTFAVTLPVEAPHLEQLLAVPSADEPAPAPAPAARRSIVEADLLVDAPLPEPLVPPVDGGAAGSGVTILVVDDNADIREYVSSCLAGAYTVVMARDGREGLERARTVQPDLIVSDVMMPVMNGFELCRAVKADPSLDHIPVILLTSRGSTDDKIEGFTAGADDYLTKPFNARELVVRVGNLLTLRLQQRDLKRLNEELQGANVSLQDLTELKSQMLRIAAHDLKSPLNAVREFARMIQEDLGDGTPATEMLDAIYNSADRMLHMVAQLLDSEALESGKLKLNRVPFDLGHLAERVVSDLRLQAERKEQQLVLAVEPGESCVVEADEGWIQEAMENLVTNAIKYSPRGKPIRVEVGRTDGQVRFAVRDEGPGLTAEDKKRLFLKFQRLSARPTGGESSTGLGLSIVQQIAELHGGRVTADGEPGVGSTFTIELSGADVPLPVS